MQDRYELTLESLKTLGCFKKVREIKNSNKCIYKLRFWNPIIWILLIFGFIWIFIMTLILYIDEMMDTFEF